jgi:hypothetical protein
LHFELPSTETPKGSIPLDQGRLTTVDLPLEGNFGDLGSFGDLKLACFAGKSVLVIDGKNRRWRRRKHKLRRRSEQQAEITD